MQRAWNLGFRPTGRRECPQGSRGLVPLVCPARGRADARSQQAHNLCFRPTGRNEVPVHRGRDFACAAGGQEGRNLRFSPSCGSPLSLRRATGAVDRSPAKRLPPTCCCDRQGLTATPEGRGISLLAAFEKWAAILWRNALLRASARPYLRQQMPQIFGQKLWCLLLLRRKRDDSQEGRNPVFSPLVRPRRAGAHTPPPAGGEFTPESAG